jgi:EAL domain-containing protein (putative c-di-GMP-specific phosphodiesterase class I)
MRDGHPARTSSRVLVLDDEPSLLEIFSEVLTEAGYEVAAAATPAAALELLGTSRFDVVLSDITMPGMSGIELLRAVRRRDPELPVVLATGNPTLETAIQAVEAGAVQYLLKPLNADALLGAVKRASQMRRMALLRHEAARYVTSHSATDGDRATLDAALDGALATLWMAYQPIVRAAGGDLFGHEALMRTQSLDLARPMAVFRAAERLGRVLDVGRAVRRALAGALDEGRLRGDVFINIHALDLTDDVLLSPDGPLSPWAPRVVVEVTERASLENVPDAYARIRALRDLGFRIAVDDLGAGYSGLSSFAALEPEIVKLDMALVRGAEREAVKQKLISSICGLCHDLGIAVVAEGVETEAERATMVRLGCDLLQGYLLGRPQPLEPPPPAWPGRP